MKDCKYQSGHLTDGCIICKKDGSRRHADNCGPRKCKRWRHTALEAFLWWWNYGTLGDLKRWLRGGRIDKNA